MTEVEIVDAEIVEPDEAALAVQHPATPINLFGANSPAQVVEKATELAGVLKDVLVKRNHIVRIGQGEHVKVEGWTTLGSMLGVTAIITHTEPLDGGGYLAHAEARTLDGRVVGAADAICTRGENQWKNRDDYALLSMAQTRAVSKSLRMPLGFVVELAGYNPTPAEEMTFDQDHPVHSAAPAAPVSEPSGEPSSGGGRTVKITEADRLDDGSFARICPYCRADVTEEQFTDRNDVNRTKVQCTRRWCVGGQPKKGKPGEYWEWSVLGSIDSVYCAGGVIDDLLTSVTADGTVQEVTVTEPAEEFDPKAYLHSVLKSAVNWSETEKKERIKVAKAEVDAGGRWTRATTQKVAALVMAAYYGDHPDDDSRPF